MNRILIPPQWDVLDLHNNILLYRLDGQLSRAEFATVARESQLNLVLDMFFFMFNSYLAFAEKGVWYCAIAPAKTALTKSSHMQLSHENFQSLCRE